MQHCKWQGFKLRWSENPVTVGDHRTLNLQHVMLLMFTWAPCQWLNLLPLFQRAALKTFINMTRGTFGPTHFLSHDIIGWSWQARTSCLKLWDFTGRLSRRNAPSALTVGPCTSKSRQLHLRHKSPRRDKHLWNVMRRLTFINYHSWT